MAKAGRLMTFKLIAAAICLVNFVSAFPSGAPEDICWDPDLFPLHGKPAIEHSVALPYTVTATAKTYQANQQITVTIRSKDGTKFRGFAVVAVDKQTGDQLGSWLPVTGLYHQLTECPVATHDNRKPKTEAVLTWVAPGGPSKTIDFTVTIVKDLVNYWIKVPVQYLS